LRDSAAAVLRARGDSGSAAFQDGDSFDGRQK
jgi:hypothetical protein